MLFRFLEDKNTMVITTKDIIEKKKEIVLVSHDEDDGMWEFLDGADVAEENAAIISLTELVNIDASVNEVSDLPLGWIAYRENKEAHWIKSENK